MGSFFTTVNVLTLLIVVATIWVAYTRYNGRLENNLPLIYYVGVVFYMHGFEDTLDPPVVYIAVVSALLLRFEFMAGTVLRLVRAVEMLFFAYVMWRSLGILLMWW